MFHLYRIMKKTNNLVYLKLQLHKVVLDYKIYIKKRTNLKSTFPIGRIANESLFVYVRYCT